MLTDSRQFSYPGPFTSQQLIVKNPFRVVLILTNVSTVQAFIATFETATNFDNMFPIGQGQSITLKYKDYADFMCQEFWAHDDTGSGNFIVTEIFTLPQV